MVNYQHFLPEILIMRPKLKGKNMLGHIMQIVTEMQSKEEMKNKKPTNLDLYIFWAIAFLAAMTILSFIVGI